MSKDMTCLMIEPKVGRSQLSSFLESNNRESSSLTCNVFEGGDGRFGRRVALFIKHETSIRTVRELNVRATVEYESA